MDHSWHHPPPPPPPLRGGVPLHGSICPVCSVAHFPFCPPLFPQNHHIHHYPPPYADQFYPRAPAQPPAQAQAPAPVPVPTPAVAPSDPFVDHFSVPVVDTRRPPADPQRPWNAGSSGFDRAPYGNMYPGYDYNNIGAKRMAFDSLGNVGAKRMRFDDPGFSSGPTDPYMNENFAHSSGFSADNERRLKLIRDHGGLANHEADRSYGEPSNFDGRTDLGFKPSKSFDTSNFQSPRYGDVDRKGTLDGQDNTSNMLKHGDVQFGQEHRIGDRNLEHGQSVYNQVGTSLYQNNVYGYSGHPTDSNNRQSQEAMGHNWQHATGASALYDEHRSGITMENCNFLNQFSQNHATQHYMEPKSNQFGSPYMNNQGGNVVNRSGMSMGLGQESHVFNGQPPPPASPPPPLPVEPPGQHLSVPLVSPSPSGASASLFPIAVASSGVAPSSYPPLPETRALPSLSFSDKSRLHSSTGLGSEAYLAFRQAQSNTYLEGNKAIPLQPPSPETPKIIDASHIIKQPYRATRPDHIVIILRGLPGSGKSYLAKMLRDLEVENGGNVPRIHCMDDYFMTETEKIEEIETSKSSGSVRGKKQITKKVVQYFYEPEMEEAYRSSMLKAFKKTLDEGVFSFIIVDDRNLRVADFAQFWATAKRSGYEVYLLEATYKDPVGCAARNVHGFTQDDIQKMADAWEEAPPLYLKLNIKSLLHGDDLEESGIQEVDMDMEDGGDDVGISGSEEKDIEKAVVPNVGDLVKNGPSEDDKRRDAEIDQPVEEVKELGKSKWSNDLDEDDIRKTEGSKRNLSALSGLIQSYSKEGKSVRWGDEVGSSGFSIAAAKNANVFSLVIGPGAGYNLKSNPLLEEEKMTGSGYSGQSKKKNIFQERLRAEHESFRAVFDKRRQRIGGLDGDDE